MEQLVVISKVKKFIKEQSGMSTSASFIEKLNDEIAQATKTAIDSAKTNSRKTVMGRDYNLFVEEPKIETVLVVASKVKKMIKEESGFSTSGQVMDQLTVRVETICKKAIENAQSSNRKTVLDRDFEEPTTI
jgi:histone H3/H4